MAPTSTPAYAGTGESNLDELPARLSPSRLSDFKQCPAKFYFGSICRLPRWATEATTVGTLAHAAFEYVFEHPRGERTVENALPYVRACWEEIKDKDDYASVREIGDALVERAEDMVRNWFAMEDPNKFDPFGRELRLTMELEGIPLLGIIDRADRIEVQGELRGYVSDYKTGKVPAPDDRFLDEKFFAMRAYALLWHHTYGEAPHELRLVYVAGASKDAIRRKRVDEQMLKATREQLRSLVREIKRSAELGKWECRKHVLCQWCDYMDICPLYHPELAGVPVGEIKRRFTNDGDETLFD